MFAYPFHCRKNEQSKYCKKLFYMFFFYFRLNSHPSVAECDGDYHHDSRKNLLQWNLPIIDAANKAGAMEFSVPASIPGDFFPVQVG